MFIRVEICQTLKVVRILLFEAEAKCKDQGKDSLCREWDWQNSVDIETERGREEYETGESVCRSNCIVSNRSQIGLY